jgi:hypothetical protein
MVETRSSVYEFPPLAECREAFARLMQQDFEWGRPEEWREVPPVPLSIRPADNGKHPCSPQCA